MKFISNIDLGIGNKNFEKKKKTIKIILKNALVTFVTF